MMAAMADAELAFSFIAELPLAASALRYAAEMHRDQHRESDESAFILHPLEVASLLYNTGHREFVVAAGILHDTIEDSDAVRGDLALRFGSHVASLVAALTEDTRIPVFEQRKAALRRQIADFGSDAIAVDAADKVAKVRELRAQAGREPRVLKGEDPPARPRVEHYVASLEMLEAAQPEHPLVRQLRFELEALRALPPRPGLIAPGSVQIAERGSPSR